MYTLHLYLYSFQTIRRQESISNLSSRAHEGSSAPLRLSTQNAAGTRGFDTPTLETAITATARHLTQSGGAQAHNPAQAPNSGENDNLLSAL
eukprot:2104381-Pyramimonas_sp.AAC.1